MFIVFDLGVEMTPLTPLFSMRYFNIVTGLRLDIFIFSEQKHFLSKDNWINYILNIDPFYKVEARAKTCNPPPLPLLLPSLLFPSQIYMLAFVQWGLIRIEE